MPLPYEHKWKIIRDRKSLQAALKRMRKAPAIGFDVETESLAWYHKDRHVCGIGLGYKDGKTVYSFYIPTKHLVEKYGEWKRARANLDLEEVIGEVKPLLESSKPKIGANVKFDAHWMHKYGVKVDPVDDIQVLARLVRTSYMRQHIVGLKKLTKLEYGDEYGEEKAIKEWWRKNKIKYGKGVEEFAYAKLPIDICGEYCCADVYWTICLFMKFYGEIRKDEQLLKLYKNVERPVYSAVIDMERNGMCVDREYLEEIDKKIKKRLKTLEKKIFKAAGKTFNLDSHFEYRPIFKELGVKEEKRRRKKPGGETAFTASMDSDVLEKYRGELPVVDMYLEWKELSKIHSSYVLNMLRRVKDAEVGLSSFIVHASINTETARTGRMSITDPPLQTLPRDEK